MKVLSILLLITFLATSCGSNYEEAAGNSGLFSGHKSVEDSFTLIPPTEKTYLDSETIDIKLEHPYNVTVTGSPRLPVDIGVSSVFFNYVSGSGSNTLTFRYTVTAGDLDLDGIAQGATIDLNGGTLTFNNGTTTQNTTTDVPNDSMSGVLVDAVAPTVAITPLSILPNVYMNGQVMSVMASFSEMVEVTGTPQVELDLEGTTVYADYISGSGTDTLIFRYTITETDVDLNGANIVSINLNGGTIKDPPGNVADISFTSPVNAVGAIVNGDKPYVVNYVLPADATYSPGEQIEFSLVFSEIVDVAGGVPSVDIDIEGVTKTANYISGTGTDTLTFRYTAFTGDVDLNGIEIQNSIALNGSTILDGGLTPALFTIAPPSTPNVLIDGTLPQVATITPPTNNTYTLGQELYFTFEYNVNVDVTGIPRVQLLLNSHNPTPVYADYSSGTGTDTLIFRYVVQNTEEDLDGITISSPIDLNGGTIIGYNGVTSDHIILTQVAATDTSSIFVDAKQPEIIAVTPPADQNYTTGQDVDFTVQFSEPVDVTGLPRLALDVGGSTLYATYSSGSGTTDLIFRYTVGGGDLDDNGIAFNATSIDLNSGTILDAVSLAAVLDFTAIQPDMSSILINSNPATQLAFSVEPVNTSYGVNIAPAIKVEIQDANGNLVNTATDNITLAINNNSGGSTLSGTLTVAAIAGVATFSDINLDQVGTGYTLDASATGLTTATSAAFDITATPTQLVITQEPSNTNNGFTIAPAMTVEIRDANNNLVSGSNANINVTINNNAGGSILSGTTTVAAVNGVATFSDLSLDQLGSGYTLDFNSPGLTAVTSAAFDITQAPATQLAFIAEPTNAQAATAISPDIKVEIQDANGNIVPTATDNITLAIGTDPSSGTAILGGTISVNAVAGVATFNDITIDKAGNGYDIVAIAGPLTQTTSNAFNITTAAATQLAFSVDPVNTSYGVNIAPAIKVEIQDANGNLVNTATDNITLAINNNSGGSTLSGTLTVAAIAGVATFSDINLDQVGTGYTLDASATGLTTATSAAFDILAGAPTQLILTSVSISDVTVNSTLSTLAVEIRDANNNLVTTATNSVNVAINTDPSGTATLNGTTNTNATSGIATFTNLNINKVGNGFDLVVSALGLTTAISNTFNVLAPQITIVTPPSAGTYSDGQNLDFVATTNANATVSGTPRIQLDIGGVTQHATYQAGLSTATNLVFRYTATVSDSDTNGIQHSSPIDLNSGTIQDSTGNDFSLEFTPQNTSNVYIFNELPGVKVSGISGLINEVGTTSATFTVSLTNAPTGNVNIPISSLDTTEGTVDTTSLVFTTANWSTPQTVTVTAVDDLIIDGNQVFEIEVGSITSSDASYNGINPNNVFVTCLDTAQSPGITITAITGNTSEDGDTATFNIVLNSQPTADVTIALSSSNTAEGTISSPSVTFTNANWSTLQQITVTGVDDALEDGDQPYTIITSSATSSDTNYNGIDPSNINVINNDNDSIGFLITSLTNDVMETGTSGTFSIKLKSPPTDNVTLPISSSDTTEGIIDVGASLVFTPANYNIPQVVTITGVDDILQDNDQYFQIILDVSTSNDANYNGINPADIEVINFDDDSFGITIGSKSSDTFEAGSQATFPIVLNSPPTADVVINLSSSDTTEGIVTPASITFTSANWSTPQSITVTGVDDALQDGDQQYDIITSPAISSDVNFNGIDPSNVTFKNMDDDSYLISVSPTTGLTVSEIGTETTFSISLGAPPNADVTIPLVSNDTGEGTVSPASVTFTSANWSIAQTVTVTGVDDANQDGNKIFTIDVGQATSADSNYNNYDPTNVIVTNTDNDSIGIYVDFMNDSANRYALQETGTFKNINVNLTSQPTANVTITYYEEDTAEGIASPAGVSGLTFTPNNWNIPQTITVTGIDDAIADGNDNWELFFNSTSSSDPNYNNLNINKIWFTTIDDDSSGILVSPETMPNQMIVWEHGTEEEFQMVLQSAPTDDVVITFSVSDTSEGSVSPSSFTFTPDNWNVPQTGIATGADDNSADGDKWWQIDSSVTSNDSAYNNMSVSPVRMITIDDDSPGYFLTPDSSNNDEIEVNENGLIAQITVALTTQPTANVTLYPYSSDTSEGVIAESQIVFTPQNWNAPQVINVMGVDDSNADGNRTFDIRWSNTQSSDGNYSGQEPARVHMVCIDNE